MNSKNVIRIGLDTTRSSLTTKLHLQVWDEYPLTFAEHWSLRTDENPIGFPAPVIFP